MDTAADNDSRLTAAVAYYSLLRRLPGFQNEAL